IKVLYIDMDNMFNSMSDSINFSETLNNENITPNSQITITNSQFIPEFNNDNKMLYITLDGTIDCFCNLNENLNVFSDSTNNLICKKTTMQTCSCIQTINKTTNYEFNFNIDDKISKILSFDSKVIIDETTCYENYILLNGQIINNIIYEVENDGINSIKIHSNSTSFKSEIEANNCDNLCFADISSYINLNDSQITTDIGDNNTKLSFDYCIISNGYVYKNLNINIIEDAYSLDSFVEPVNSMYNLCQKSFYIKTCENIDSEITLADELNVDEILGMVNTSANITQYSIKQNTLVIEGVINGNLLYLDENHEIKHLATQLPYSISIKQEFENELCGLHITVIPKSCKCKIKRGNTLMIDYELALNGNVYSKHQVQLISDIKLGKMLDYGDVSLQIYIARPNESDWELCKRLHVSHDKLLEFNADTPNTYMGGEKIIIYR
ncbi:MAG: DUF3794 domain-containing protein, partial [Clostridia bacterium]